MARNTLSWYKCSLCGRRGATFTCAVKGKVEELCIYCLATFVGIVKVTCKKIPLSLRVSYSGVKGPDERLFKKFKIS